MPPFGEYLRGFLFSRPRRRCMSEVMSKDVLSRLAAIIKSRRHARPEDSHTRRLLDDGPIKPAKKLGEEAVEVAIAALSQGKKALVGESADLLYHLLVVLESREVDLDDVFEELERRMALTAVGEKRQKTASR
jgi:phosphoribosyl-ATP pyrophosphohydrolase